MTDNIIDLQPWIDRLQAAENNEREYFAEREEQQRETEEQLENWDRYLAARGLTENDGPEDPDGGFISKIDREVNRVLAEFEALVDRQVRNHDDALAALDDIRRALDPTSSVPERQVRDPHPDEPLNVLQVLCLPELGGQLYVGEGTPGTPSRNIKEKTIRGAWDRGDLGFLMLGKNKFTTRAMIKEWLEECRETSKNPTSSNETRAERIQAASYVKEPGRPWIDLDNGIFYRAAIGELVPHNKRAEPIAIPERLLRLMRRWHKGCGKVKPTTYLVEYQGKPVDCRKGFYTLKNDVLSEERAAEVNRHTLKHTCVTWLLQQGVSVEDVADYVSTTPAIIRKVYKHVIPGEYSKVHQVLAKKPKVGSTTRHERNKAA